jgi:hypothetical protein
MSRPICKQCNTNLCKTNGVSKKGNLKYKKYCSTCEKKVYNQTLGKNHTRKLGYKLHKKDRCENCGFVPIHSCQLDVDHIDGNKHNDDISNLRTLCANCHRLKTYIQRSPQS